MTAYKRLAELVYRLSVLTERKKISWERTLEEGEFQCSFPGFTVILSVQYGDAEGFRDPEQPLWVLSIRNSLGTVVESVNDEDLNALMDSPAAIMRTMWESARRQALGVEEAVDTILSFLGPTKDFPPLPQPRNRPGDHDGDDEDLPF